MALLAMALLTMAPLTMALLILTIADLCERDGGDHRVLGEGAAPHEVVDGRAWLGVGAGVG